MNWSAADLAARGFDPATGARVAPPNPRPVTAEKTRDEAWSPRVAAGGSPVLSASARSYLKPEQLLQVEVVEAVRPRLIPGARLIALNGELPGGSRLFQKWQTIKAAMGYEAGTPDLAALHLGRAYFLELKRPAGQPDLLGHRKARGELSGVQRTWRDWATAEGFPWAVCRSVAEVEAALRTWGMTA